MAFLLHGHKSQHGNEPVLVYWDGHTAVHVELESLINGGHMLPNGDIVKEPFQFASFELAAMAAALMPMKQTIVDSDIVTQDGKVTAVNIKPFTIPVDPPQKPSKNVKLETDAVDPTAKP